MNIQVNGTLREFEENIVLEKLMAQLGLNGKVMAAALNMEIVKQENWATCKLKDGDKVELLDFVGGG